MEISLAEKVAYGVGFGCVLLLVFGIIFFGLGFTDEWREQHRMSLALGAGLLTLGFLGGLFAAFPGFYD